jgi:hypothetical protein
LQVMAQQRLIFNHQQFHRALPSKIRVSKDVCPLQPSHTQ